MSNFYSLLLPGIEPCLHQKLTLAVAAFLIIACGAAAAAEEGSYGDVPLRVDSIRVASTGTNDVIVAVMSGFPPGFFQVKCAAYDHGQSLKFIWREIFCGHLARLC
jgi:hypothetical protein